MSASRFIGRIGGLAIALGVGAVGFGGTAVAWADSPSSGTGSSARSDSSSSAPSSQGAAKRAGPKASKSPNSAAATNGANGSSNAALPANAKTSTPVLDRTRTEVAEASASAAPVVTASVDTTPEVVAASVVPALVPALERGTVSVAAKLAPAKGAAGDNPVSPVGALVDLALLEYARRETPSAAAAFAPAAAAAVSVAPDSQVQAAAATNVTLIMTPSGVAIPKDTYVPNVESLYFPGVTDGQFLFTPEGLYPISGVKSLPLNTSVDQGNAILLSAIKEQVAAGNTVSVFGYSQSSIISSQVLEQLQEAGVPAGSVNFVLVGNEMNPNGGFLSRFPDFDMPSLGIPFYGPTPVETNYQLVNYTLEYDGFADFPRYPLNVLSVLNAGLGIVFVHGTYTSTTDLTPEDIANAIPLPSSLPNQQYFILPTENLPLLEPLRFIPLIGNPIADLLQPALRVIVNLGYGDPKYGWSTNGYANEVTTFGVFPDVDPIEVITLFVQGIQQGVQDFIADILPGGVMWQEFDALFAPLSNAVSSVSLDTPSDFVAAVQSVITDALTFVSTAVTNVANFVSNAAASLYATLLPTADIVNAIFTVLPAYDLSLFLDGVEQMLSGDVIDGFFNSIFMPLAATSGLLTTAALIELLVIAQGVLGAFGINLSV